MTGAIRTEIIPTLSEIGEIALKFPLPIITVQMSQCSLCKFCCQWCGYISEKGCQAPHDYDMLEVCKSFPVLIGNKESRWPSFGVEEQGDVYPPEFGAFAVYGRCCQSTQDERQRIVFQYVARLINAGKRSFTMYEECEDYSLFIDVKDPRDTNKSGIQ